MIWLSIIIINFFMGSWLKSDYKKAGMRWQQKDHNKKTKPTQPKCSTKRCLQKRKNFDSFWNHFIIFCLNNKTKTAPFVLL